MNPLPPAVFLAPGAYRYRGGDYYRALLDFARLLREQDVWRYPDLPGALTTYGEIVASRQWKITGAPRAAARGVEFINSSTCYLDDGTVEYGFENFLKRRCLDHNVMGIRMFTWQDDGLEYVDPAYALWNNTEKNWEINQWEKRRISARSMIVNKAIPIGGTSRWISPVMTIMPTAILAWLVNEHDTASADGRKIRDIILVGSQDVARDIAESAEEHIKIYSGELNPAEVGVNVIGMDLPPNVSMSDMIARLGLAEIPDKFEREEFQFRWVNSIATALGMPLRYFWNSEKATNRALEEVQEARSSQRGPGAFIRTEERLINHSGAFKQISRTLRLNFIDRTDPNMIKVQADALKANIEALKTMTDITTFKIDSEALIRWQQSLGSLPPDLEVMKNTVDKIPNSDMTADGEQTIQPDSDTPVEAQTKLQEDEKSIPDYDEISMDINGMIIERRRKVYTVTKAVFEEAISDPEVIEEAMHDGSIYQIAEV